MGKDKNKEQDGGTAASTESITSPWDACQTNRDLSWEREARDAALAKTIAKVVAKEMAKAHAHDQALLNDRSTPTTPTSLKVTSRANGFKVMDPFDWTKNQSYLPEMAIVVRVGYDSPLVLWKETQKRLRVHTFTIGSMEREYDILSHGKTTKPSFASLSMMD